jgi:hypothetical protein
VGTSSPATAERDPAPDHDLAVTHRCIKDDLDANPDLSIGELAAEHPIVEKFRHLRSQSPIGQERVQALSGQEFFTLHAGRLRGATWHDRIRNAVWLVGVAVHRENSFDDAYKHFARLHRRDALLPDETDIDRLFEARNRQILPDALFQVESLLQLAKTSVSEEHTLILRDGTQVSIVVEADEALTERSDWHLEAIIYVGVIPSVTMASSDLLQAMFATLVPTVTWEAWEYNNALPKRPARPGELVWCLG